MQKKFLLILILLQINIFGFKLKLIKTIETNIIIGNIFTSNNKIIICDKINDKLKIYTNNLTYKKEISYIYYGNKKIYIETNNLDISEFNQSVFINKNKNLIIFDTTPMIVNYIKTQIDLIPLQLYFLANNNIIACFNREISNISIINNKASIVKIYNLKPTQHIIGKSNNYIFINDLIEKEIFVITDYGKIINKIKNPIYKNTKKLLPYNTNIILIPSKENYIIIKNQIEEQKVKCPHIKQNIQDATILKNNLYFLTQDGKIFKYKILHNTNSNISK